MRLFLISIALIAIVSAEAAEIAKLKDFDATKYIENFSPLFEKPSPKAIKEYCKKMRNACENNLDLIKYSDREAFRVWGEDEFCEIMQEKNACENNENINTKMAGSKEKVINELNRDTDDYSGYFLLDTLYKSKNTKVLLVYEGHENEAWIMAVQFDKNDRIIFEKPIYYDEWAESYCGGKGSIKNNILSYRLSCNTTGDSDDTYYEFSCYRWTQNETFEKVESDCKKP